MYIGSNLWNHIGGLVHVAWRRFLIESLNIWFNKCIAAIYLVTKRFSRLDKDCYVLITNIMSKCIYFYLRLLISFAWSLVIFILLAQYVSLCTCFGICWSTNMQIYNYIWLSWFSCDLSSLSSALQLAPQLGYFILHV